MSRLTFTALAVSALLVGSASAADMSMKAAPVAAPASAAAFSWTGAYVGGSAGYAWGWSKVTDQNGYNSLGSSFSYHPDGGIFGLHAGYNLQYDMFVVGAEAELGWLGLDGGAQYPAYVGTRSADDSRASIRTDFYTALTARVGVTPMDLLLVYGKGGVAFANLKTSFIDPDPIGTTLVSGTSRTTFKAGWTVGGGLEYALADNWVARVEYDHYDFGKQSHTATSAGGGSFGFEHAVRADVVRVGVSYLFGGPAPAVFAKY
ncbi:MAG: porin family protein [Phyllobacteriaceae bacterium]|nr:porin family protein [Phyllobacteriaceae bacterium]